MFLYEDNPYEAEQGEQDVCTAPPTDGRKTLRDYQCDILAAVNREFAIGTQSVLVVLFTGGGKTVVFARQASEWRQGNVLIVAHRIELLDQAADKLQSELGYRPPIEQGDRGLGCDDVQLGGNVIVGSVQTLTPKRMEKYRNHPFGLVIFDESHHAISASWQRIKKVCLEFNPDCKFLGVTATPKRTDKAALGLAFDATAYTMNIMDGIDKGWLVPVRMESIYLPEDACDFSEVLMTRNKFGEVDFAQASLEAILTEEGPLHAMAKPILDRCVGQSLVYTAGVTHAHLLAKVLNRYKPGCAAAVDGKTETRQRNEINNWFHEGKIQYLLNFGTHTEGYDSPTCKNIVMGRPTKSVSLFCLSRDTEILTDAGWRGEADWDQFDGSIKAAGFVPGDSSIVWTDIIGKYRRPLNDGEQMYCLESGQTSVRVTQNHRLLYRSKASRSGEFKFIESQELAERSSEYEIPVAGFQDAPGVPLSDADLEFIGWMMTDGTVNKKTKAVLIRQAAHQPWLDVLERTIQRCGFKYNRTRLVRKTQFSDHADTVQFTVCYGAPRATDKHLTGWGRLEPFYAKDMHPSLENMDRRQLSIMLEAIHLGDGTKMEGQSWTRRSYHIATGNKVFAERLQSLCVRRGFRCNMASPTYNEGPLYILHIKDTATRHVGGKSYADRPTLRESPTHPGEIVWCVTTGTGTIVARRNGKVTIMGQTQMLGRGTRPLTGVVDGLPDALARKKAIAESGKPYMTLIDFCGNTRHRPASCVDALGGDYDVEIRELAAEMAKDGKKQDVKDLFEKARVAKILGDLRAFDEAMAAAEKKKEDARQKIIAKNVRYEVRQLQSWDEVGDMGNEVTTRRGGASEKQIAMLTGLGVKYETAAGYGKRQAGAVIDTLSKTRCTAKQANILRQYGHEPAGINMEAASKIIDGIKARGWK